MNKISMKKHGNENGSEVVAAGPLLRRTTQMLAVLCVCGWLAACDTEGPAERAGERVDETATDVGNAIEDKCEEAKEQAGAEDTDC